MFSHIEECINVLLDYVTFILYIYIIFCIPYYFPKEKTEEKTI